MLFTHQIKYIPASVCTVSIPAAGSTNSVKFLQYPSREFSPCTHAMDSALISPLPRTHVSSLVLQPSPFECIVYDIIDEDIPRPPDAHHSLSPHPKPTAPPTLPSALPETTLLDHLCTRDIPPLKAVHLSPVSSCCTPRAGTARTASQQFFTETEYRCDHVDDGNSSELMTDSNVAGCVSAPLNDSDLSVAGSQQNGNTFDSTKDCEASGANSRSGESARWGFRFLLPSLQDNYSARPPTPPASVTCSPSFRETGKYGPLRY